MGLPHNLPAPPLPRWLGTCQDVGDGPGRAPYKGKTEKKWCKTFCVQTLILVCMMVGTESRQTLRARSFETGANARLVPRGSPGEQHRYGPSIQVSLGMSFVWNTTMIRLLWCYRHCLKSWELVFPWAFPTLCCLLHGTWLQAPWKEDYCLILCLYNASCNEVLASAVFQITL